MTLDLIKALIPLLLIVALLYGVLVFIKKYGIKFKGKNEPDSLKIKVLSNQMIMPKRFISVVKIEDKKLVLGISEHSITLLKELDSAVNDFEMRKDEPGKENFLDVLKKNFGLR
jgi:flagellar protein FliO/FliZ